MIDFKSSKYQSDWKKIKFKWTYQNGQKFKKFNWFFFFYKFSINCWWWNSCNIESWPMSLPLPLFLSLHSSFVFFNPLSRPMIKRTLPLLAKRKSNIYGCSEITFKKCKNITKGKAMFGCVTFFRFFISVLQDVDWTCNKIVFQISTCIEELHKALCLFETLSPLWNLCIYGYKCAHERISKIS